MRTRVTQITRNRSSDVALEAKTSRDAQWKRSITLESIEHCLRSSKERTRMSICDKKRAYFTRIESLTLEKQSTKILCVGCALSESDVVLSYVFWTCLRCKLTNHRVFETDHFGHKSDERIKRVYWFVKNRLVRIESSTIQSKIDIRILRIQIDIRLKWDPHVRKVQKKMIRQFMTLTKMSTFTWDVIFRKIRVLYTFVIRSVLTYGTAIWHTLKTKKTRITSKLAVIQNKCLRSIFEVFRVTFVSILEIETHVLFIDLHLNQLQTHARYCMQIESMSLMIRRECDKITHKLSTSFNRFRIHREISDEFNRAWAELQLFTNQRSSTNVVLVSWANQTRLVFEQWKFHRQRKKKVNSHHVVRWKQKWKIYCDIVFTSTSTQTENIDKKRLQLHDQLKKIESLLSTQIRIEKIDFVGFLFRRKILEVTSISCRCDWDNQTIKHVIMFCELINDRSSMLSVVDITDYHQMMTSSKRFKIIIKWLFRHDLLSQFALIIALLYEH